MDEEKQIYQELEQVLQRSIVAAADRLTIRLLRHANRLLAGRRARMGGFEQRLTDRWAKALDLYELTLYLAQQCGDYFNKTFRPIAAERQDYKFEALSRLQGHAALIAGEVLQLLKGGYASGAHARWRSLHETAVVAMFIADEDSSIAERFIWHRVVKTYEDAQKYQQHCARLGQPKFTDAEMEQLRREFEEAISRFGKDFAEGYGWAKPAIARRNPTRNGRVRFSEIKEAAEVEFWTPYYRMASHAVHPTATSIDFNLGLIPPTKIILAGPTNAGFADPGHGAILSLCNATAILMTYSVELTTVGPEQSQPAEILKSYEPSFTVQAMVRSMSVLSQRAGEAFGEIQEQLRR